MNRKCSLFIHLCKSKRVLQNIEGLPISHDFRETPISTKIFGISFCVADWRISAFRPPPDHFALFLFFPSFYLSTFLCIDTQSALYRFGWTWQLAACGFAACVGLCGITFLVISTGLSISCLIFKLCEKTQFHKSQTNFRAALVLSSDGVIGFWSRQIVCSSLNCMTKNLL